MKMSSLYILFSCLLFLNLPNVVSLFTAALFIWDALCLRGILARTSSSVFMVQVVFGMVISASLLIGKLMSNPQCLWQSQSMHGVLSIKFFPCLAKLLYVSHAISMYFIFFNDLCYFSFEQSRHYQASQKILATKTTLYS